MVTDINGRVIASSDPEMNGKDLLTRLEKKHLEDTPGAVIFRVPGGAREAVQADPCRWSTQRICLGL